MLSGDDRKLKKYSKAIRAFGDQYFEVHSIVDVTLRPGGKASYIAAIEICGCNSAAHAKALAMFADEAVAQALKKHMPKFKRQKFLSH